MDLRALIFVPALVGSTISVFLFLLFAANYYLTIIENTAAGAKEVQWEFGESISGFWKPFYLGWLLCLWLGPAYVLGRFVAKSSGHEWVGLAVPVLVAWLLYPVSQLSSLSSLSMWMPLNPQAVTRLLQRPATTLSFFALTLPVFALGGLAFRWSFQKTGEWELLFAGMPLLVLAGFLYARLLGRLAFVLMFTKDLLKRKKKKKRSEEPRPSVAETDPVPVQPSELPPLASPDGELHGYNVLIADDPPAPKKRVKAELADDPPPPPVRVKPHPLDRARTWTEEDEDTTPYDMKGSEVKPDERVPEAVLKPTAEAMALLDRRDAPKRPKRAWTSELFVFFGQPATISAMVILCGIGVVAGAMVRIARQFNPVGGGE
jgi:hypothetical protein